MTDLDSDDSDFVPFEDRATEILDDAENDTQLAICKLLTLLIELNDVQLSLLCEIAESLDLRTVKKS